MRERERENLVSIIIPVYNSEKYIERTLNNLFKQTYQNFEIIIAYDEKSKDNTELILKKYQNNKNIIIDIGNDSSTGAARNRGLKFAKGEFIVFVDADDIILPNYLENMINVFEQYPELKVVCCNTLCIKDNNLQQGLQIAEKSDSFIKIYYKEEALLLKVNCCLVWGVWAHMIRRDYILQNNLYFPDYTAREDLVYTLKLFMNTDKVGYTSKISYIYLKHDASVTATKFDVWWDMAQPSRNDLKKLSVYLPKNVGDQIKFRDERLVASAFACIYNYNIFKSELKKHGISKLSFCSCGDSNMSRLSVIVFNISKYAYWKCIRYMKKV